MKAVIVGCGRVGALLATILDAAGNDVSVIDVSTVAFDRLPSGFRGTAIRGNGTDEAVLRRAGAAGADIFLAMTEGDNRNVMSAQLATEVFEVRTVIAKINDPVRAEAYAELGIATLCRTTLMSDAVLGVIGLPTSGSPPIRAPKGHHPGGEEHPLAAQDSTSTPIARMAVPAVEQPAPSVRSAAADFEEPARPMAGPERAPARAMAVERSAAARATTSSSEPSTDTVGSRRRWRLGGFRQLTGEG